MSEGQPLVFWCDGKDCGEVLVTRTTDEISAYIKLYSARWVATELARSLGFIRRHYCPAHTGQAR